MQTEPIYLTDPYRRDFRLSGIRSMRRAGLAAAGCLRAGSGVRNLVLPIRGNGLPEVVELHPAGPAMIQVGTLYLL